MCQPVVLLVALLAAAVTAAPAQAAWRWPVRGEVIGAFRYSARAPFEAGQRRGIDIAAAPGATVRAACAGRVTFAGRTPAGELGVTVRCGDLAATHLGIATLAVRRGARVAVGAGLGRAGAGGRIRLGARVATRRFAYVDPLTLLAGDAVAGRPLAPAIGRAPRGPTFGAAPRPAPVGARRLPASRARSRPSADAVAHVPRLAWLGAALLAAGTGAGSVVRRRRRTRPATTGERPVNRTGSSPGAL